MCSGFPISAPQHELSWLFPGLCHIGFHGIKAYLSIAAHACERFAQCSNTIYSMTDIDKWLENAVQPSCSGFEKENLPPDSRLWLLYSNPHIVCPMLSSLQISGWLSSVKTVALKRENIHFMVCQLIPLSCNKKARSLRNEIAKKPSSLDTLSDRRPADFRLRSPVLRHTVLR